MTPNERVSLLQQMISQSYPIVSSPATERSPLPRLPSKKKQTLIVLCQVQSPDIKMLAVWWYTYPSEKYESQWEGLLYPIYYGKITSGNLT